MGHILEIKLPVDLASTITGGVSGLLLVLFWDWLTKPRVWGFDTNTVKDNVNFGILYKLKFKVRGLRSPGFCELQIHWCGNITRAKWDELPNPLRNDDPNKFDAGLVPQTFFLPLMLEQVYYVPILHKDGDGNYTIFSAWWFGRNKGYGLDPNVNKKTQIKLVIKGNDLSWEKELLVEDIISTTINV